MQSPCQQAEFSEYTELTYKLFNRATGLISWGAARDYGSFTLDQDYFSPASCVLSVPNSFQDSQKAELEVNVNPGFRVNISGFNYAYLKTYNAGLGAFSGSVGIKIDGTYFGGEFAGDKGVFALNSVPSVVDFSTLPIFPCLDSSFNGGFWTPTAGVDHRFIYNFCVKLRIWRN